MLSVDPVILGMIAMYPASGYDMKSELEKGGAGMFSALTFGSIYPRLSALEEEGYIVSFAADNQGRRRKLHELTAKGWQALADWLTEPPAYPLPMRDELLLKLSFWYSGRGDDRATLIALLERRRQQSRELLDYLEAWPKNGFSYISEYSMIALNYVRTRLEAELRWIEESITQLERPPKGPEQDPRGLAQRIRERRAAAYGAAGQPDPTAQRGDEHSTAAEPYRA
jgi:PadR family transcriptional regulator, regulatory protein AphA